jgi:hypothetical protein
MSGLKWGYLLGLISVIDLSSPFPSVIAGAAIGALIGKDRWERIDLSGAAPARSPDRPLRSRMSLQLGLNSGVLTSDTQEGARSGDGIVAGISQGFTDYLSLFATASGSSSTEGGFSQIDFGGRYLFAHPSRRIMPFLDLSTTVITFPQDDFTYRILGNAYQQDADLQGWGTSLGAGFRIARSPQLAFDASVQLSWGTLNQALFDSCQRAACGTGPWRLTLLDDRMSTTRFQAVVAWYPRGAAQR